jgi:hypothetical protein
VIHHISISAEDPLHVATVLAELFGTSQVHPFPANHNSYVALALDTHGTFVEVYPSGITLIHGHGDGIGVAFQQTNTLEHPHSFHANISVLLSEEEVFHVAQREGWRVVTVEREFSLKVIELWVENKVLLELMPPDFTSAYLSFFNPENLRRLSESGSQQTT